MRMTLLWLLSLAPLIVIGKPTKQTNEATIDKIMERFKELKMVIRNVTTSLIDAPINGTSTEEQECAVACGHLSYCEKGECRCNGPGTYPRCHDEKDELS